ncbi:MAG TPA: hypothetical protein VMY98_09940 [Anaerolineae bacterium]|nr:hypothetical protein [Anaerolineae bacterium]
MMNSVLIVLLSATVILLIASATGLDYSIERAWTFRRKRLQGRARTGRARGANRTDRTAHYETDLRELRDFVTSLHLGTSLDETLSGALASTANQLRDRGLLGERLQAHVETRLAIAPEEVIEALAQDFQSAHLRDLVQRLEMARDGGISYDQALSLTLSLVEEEIRGDILRDIQQAPIKLTFPMIAGVFIPAIFIGIYPLVANIFVSLRGPGP